MTLTLADTIYRHWSAEYETIRAAHHAGKVPDSVLLTYRKLRDDALIEWERLFRAAGGDK